MTARLCTYLPVSGLAEGLVECSGALREGLCVDTGPLVPSKNARFLRIYYSGSPTAIQRAICSATATTVTETRGSADSCLSNGESGSRIRIHELSTALPYLHRQQLSFGSEEEPRIHSHEHGINHRFPKIVKFLCSFIQ